MNNRNIFALAAAMLFAANVQSQVTAKPVITGTSTGTPKSDKPVWTIGLSWAVVDDDGEPLKNLFNMSDSWHFQLFPTRVNVDMAIDPTWSFEAALTYNVLKTGKIQNDFLLAEDGMFLAFDANAKYHFIKKTKVFDPYGTAGLGYTYRSTMQYQTPTVNAGIGANIWFVPAFGLNLQSTVKFALVGNSSSYMLHSAGLVYRLGK